MDARVRHVVVEATRASDEERVTFGEVVMKLTQAGVERYHFAGKRRTTCPAANPKSWREIPSSSLPHTHS
jgi:hypothetical protein